MVILSILKYFIMFIGCAESQEGGPRPIKIIVKCSVNCNPTYLELPFELNVICDDCPSFIKFSWSVSPRMGYFDFLKNATTSEKGRKLEVKANMFKVGDQISFMALAWGQSGEILIIFEEKPPTFFINCKENCPLADSQKDSIFTVVCEPSCKKATIIWSLFPDILNFSTNAELSEGNLTLTIKAGTLLYKYVYTLYMEANGIKHNTTISTTLESTNLHISCHSNCQEYVLTHHSLSLVAVCFECKEGGTIEWVITPSVKDYKTFGPRGKYLSIPPNSFLGGVKGKINAHLSGEGGDSWSFVTKSTCMMQPASGYSGVTNFAIDCLYVNDAIVSVFQRISSSGLCETGVLMFYGSVNHLRKHNFWLLPGNPAYVHILISDWNHNFVLRPFVNYVPRNIFIGIESLVTDHYFGKKYSEGSFSYALYSKNWNKAIQIAALIILLLQEVADKGFVDHFKFHIITDIELNVQHMHYEQVISLMMMISSNVTRAREGHVISETILKAMANIKRDIPYMETRRLACQILGSYSLLASLSNAAAPSLKSPNYVDNVVDEYVAEYYDFFFERARTLYHLKWTNYFITEGMEKLAHLGFDYEKLHLTCFENGMISYTEKILGSGVVAAENISSYVSFPEAWSNQSSSWYVQLALMRPNIFWWHNVGKDLKSEIIMVNIYKNQKRQIYVHDKIDFYIESNSTGGVTIKGNLTEEIAVFYKILGKKGGSLFFNLIHLGKDYFVFFSQTYPNLRDAKQFGERVVRNNHTYFLMKYDYLYLVVHKYLPEVADFVIDVKLLRCETYEENSRLWVNRFCKLGPYSNESHTHCQCNHLSMFAVSHVGISYVKAVFDDHLRVTQYPMPSRLILILFGILLVCWCGLMLIADKRDRSIEDHCVITKPFDTIPGDQHLYLVTVETGGSSLAETSATVILQIYGEKRSRKHIISGVNRLTSYSKNTYALFCPKYLGELHSIRLFHDVSGRKPHWFCGNVIVKHIKSSKIYKFEVNNWFSLLKGDGRVCRITMLSKTTKEHPFFMTYKLMSMEDSVVFALLNKPASSFNAKERLAIAFTVVLVTFCCILLFMGVTERTGWDQKQYFSITIEQIIYVVYSILVSFPICTLVIVLFQRSRPYKTKIH